jgi:hypothetical protein
MGQNVLRAGQVAGGALLAFGTIATKAAADFETPMRNVNSILRVSESELADLEHQVINLSKTVPQTAPQLAEGLYQLVSAGVPADQLMNVLAVSAKGASAGLTDTETATNALVAVVKGFNLSWDQSSVVMDKLFQDVNLGIVTFPELASSIQPVIPLAAALGVSLDEVLGVNAALTGITGTSAEVMTQERSAMQAFLAPTKEMAGALRTIADPLIEQHKLSGPLVDDYAKQEAKLFGLIDQERKLEAITKGGIAGSKEQRAEYKRLQDAVEDQSKTVEKSAAALGPAIVQNVGFAGAVKLIGDQAGGNTAKLQDMFGRVEALTAVLAILGNQSDDVTIKTEAMAKASDDGGEAAKAFTEQAKGANFHLQMWKNTAQAWLIEAGLPLLHSFGDVGIALLGLESGISSVARAAPLLTGVFLGMGGGIMNAAGSIGSIVALIGVGGPLLLGIAAVAIAIGLLALAWKNDWGGIQEKTKDAVDNISGMLDILLGKQAKVKSGPDVNAELAAQVSAARGITTETTPEGATLTTQEPGFPTPLGPTSGPFTIISDAVHGVREVYQNAAGEWWTRLQGSYNIPPPDYVFQYAEAFAAGGIVTRPTLAMIGEGGEPEAVVPLSKWGGGSFTFNIGGIHVTGASKDEIIAEAVDQFARQLEIAFDVARGQGTPFPIALQART